MQQILFLLMIHELFAARDEKIPLENEQTIKFPVAGSPLSTSQSPTQTSSPLQTVLPSSLSRREALPRRSLTTSAFRFMSTPSKAFSRTTGLPLNSSPAPFKRNEPKSIANKPLKRAENRTIEKAAGEGTESHILRR